MKNAKKSLMDILRRGFRARSAISDIAVSRYPKSWQAQTDYNPVLPGAGRPEPIDMRPKAVEEREKQVRAYSSYRNHNICYPCSDNRFHRQKLI